VNINNPESFLARSRGSGGTRSVKITSIQRLDANPSCVEVVCTAQIRIKVIEGQQNATEVKELPQIITMDYSFTNVNLKIEERYVNPLGFRVWGYKIVQENL
jgi:type IV secretory pathway component VirB8